MGANRLVEMTKISIMISLVGSASRGRTRTIFLPFFNAVGDSAPINPPGLRQKPRVHHAQAGFFDLLRYLFPQNLAACHCLEQ